MVKLKLKIFEFSRQKSNFNVWCENEIFFVFLALLLLIFIVVIWQRRNSDSKFSVFPNKEKILQKLKTSKRKMSIFVAEGYDFNLIIEARTRTKAPSSRGKKISGFWRFMCIRRDQLTHAGDDIIHDDLALKDKVAQEWDNLGRKKQHEFKVLAK